MQLSEQLISCFAPVVLSFRSTVHAVQCSCTNVVTAGLRGVVDAAMPSIPTLTIPSEDFFLHYVRLTPYYLSIRTP